MNTTTTLGLTAKSLIYAPGSHPPMWGPVTRTLREWWDSEEMRAVEVVRNIAKDGRAPFLPVGWDGKESDMEPYFDEFFAVLTDNDVTALTGDPYAQVVTA